MLDLQFAVRLPPHGERHETVRFLTDPPSAIPVEVRLALSGRAVRVPYIETMPKPAQVTLRLGEPVEHFFEVDAAEAIGSDPWITGMRADHPEAAVELLVMKTIRENIPARMEVRRYSFLLRAPGPRSIGEPLAFTLQETSAAPPVRPSPTYTMRVDVAPSIAVIPESVLFVIDDTTEFPQSREVRLLGTADGGELSVESVACAAEWIKAEILAVSEGSKDAHTRARIVARIDTVPGLLEDKPSSTDLRVQLSKPTPEDVLVPVTVIDRRMPGPELKASVVR